MQICIYETTIKMFKNIYFIFLQVFDVSYFNIGGSIEHPQDPPQNL